MADPAFTYAARGAVQNSKDLFSCHFFCKLQALCLWRHRTRHVQLAGRSAQARRPATRGFYDANVWGNIEQRPMKGKP